MRLFVVLFAGLVLSPLFASLSPTKPFVVASGSMEPTIPTGSIVFAERDDVRVGDIVVYDSALGVPQVHRLVEVRETEDGVRYVLQGDANPAVDSFLVSESQLVGTVQRHVPLVGWLWLAPGGVQFALFGLALVGYVLLTWWESRRLSSRRLELTAVALVCLLVLPAASAGVQVAYPGSAPTADVFEDSPLPMSAGPMGTTLVDADENGADVTADAPKLWKEIVLWGCDPDDTSEAGCVLADASTSYKVESGSLTLVDAALYPDTLFFVETFMRGSSVTDTVSVRLYDVDGAAAVIGSEVTVTGDSLQWARGDGFQLSGSNEYRFQYKASATASEEIHMVKLVAAQSYPTATETVVRVAGADSTGSTAARTSARSAYFTHDSSLYDGSVAVYFEVVGAVDAGTVLPDGNVALYDENDALVAGSTLTFTSTTVDRKRSADIATGLSEGTTYHVAMDIDGGLLNPHVDVHIARLIIQQTGSWSETVRVIDFGIANETASTSYVDEGAKARYQTDSEWGNRSGFVEAGLRNTDGSGAAAVRLVDDGDDSVLAGSTLSDAADAWTRVRSDWLTLGTSNVTLHAEAQANGAGTTELAQVWLLLPQNRTKVYDHVLRTDNDHGPACVWDFTLEAVSSSGLARIDWAVVTLREDAGSADQVAIAAGSMVQSEGPAVSVSSLEALEYVVETEPASAGTTTLDLILKGRCQGSGIHTVQDLTLTLG